MFFFYRELESIIGGDSMGDSEAKSSVFHSFRFSVFLGVYCFSSHNGFSSLLILALFCYYCLACSLWLFLLLGLVSCVFFAFAAVRDLTTMFT